MTSKKAARTLAMSGMIAVLALALLSPRLANSDDTAAAGNHAPRYTDDGRLIPPADYREWIYLSTGLDMSYNEKANASGMSVFDNVFVDPESYRAFRETGTWPDKTQLVLEVRGARSKGSINRHGHFQTHEIDGVEVHVKDTARFDGGWAFFGTDGHTPAAKIPDSASCYSCHRGHAAVDTTFMQFYPTLLPIATQKGTLSAAYLEDEAATVSAKAKTKPAK